MKIFKINKKFLKNNIFRVYGFDKFKSTIKNKNYHHYKIDICKCNLPTLPPINILINNAGIQTMANDAYQDIYVNLNGTIGVTEKYGINKNIKSIINIASASARTGAEFSTYAASKGGMVAYMKSVAQRISKLNKWCNCNEIADLVYFLSYINKSITAQDILIDNGEDAKCNFII